MKALTLRNSSWRNRASGAAGRLRMIVGEGGGCVVGFPPARGSGPATDGSANHGALCRWGEKSV